MLPDDATICRSVSRNGHAVSGGGLGCVGTAGGCGGGSGSDNTGSGGGSYTGTGGQTVTGTGGDRRRRPPRLRNRNDIPYLTTSIRRTYGCGNKVRRMSSDGIFGHQWHHQLLRRGLVIWQSDVGGRSPRSRTKCAPTRNWSSHRPSVCHAVSRAMTEPLFAFTHWDRRLRLRHWPVRVISWCINACQAAKSTNRPLRSRARTEKVVSVTASRWSHDAQPRMLRRRAVEEMTEPVAKHDASTCADERWRLPHGDSVWVDVRWGGSRRRSRRGSRPALRIRGRRVRRRRSDERQQQLLAERNPKQTVKMLRSRRDPDPPMYSLLNGQRTDVSSGRPLAVLSMFAFTVISATQEPGGTVRGTRPFLKSRAPRKPNNAAPMNSDFKFNV